MQEYSLLQYECVFGIVLIGDEVEVELSQERKPIWLKENEKAHGLKLSLFVIHVA